MNNLIQAEIYANELFEISKEIGYKEGIAMGLTLLGRVATKNKDFNKAQEYLFKALSIYEEMQHAEGQCDVLRGIGDLFFLRTKYQNAIQYYKKSLDLAFLIGDPKQICVSDSSLSKSYELLGITDSAFHYFKEYAHYQDSLVNTEK